MSNKSTIIRLWLLINLTIINAYDYEWTTVSTELARPNICTGLQPGTNVRDIKDCNSYYQCENGIPIHKTCPMDQLFNYITEECDEPHKVDCFECPTNRILNDIYVPNQCNQFIRCYKNIGTQLTCSNGLYFDRDLQMCNLATTNLCPFNVLCPKINDLPIFIRDRDSCDRYYFCNDGEIIESFCPPSLHFNLITNQCDHPQNSGCLINIMEFEGSGPQ